MATSPPLHPAPQSYSGKVHYQAPYAIFDIASEPDLVLLISDSPFTGVWDFQKAAQTSLSLQVHYAEGADATLHGIILDHTINGQQRRALHMF